jgi:sugar phosphate isomerase/epimerase
MTAKNPLAVFVKPWKAMSLPALGAHVRRIGFEWIELPVRPGFPCQPQSIERDLPEAVRVLGEEGVRILNVAVDLPLDDERLYAACAAAGIDLNRVMFRTGKRNYWEAEADARRQLDAALPLCERYGVRLGVQNHCNDFVGVHELGLHHLLVDYDRRYVGAIWDAAHNALEGMAPEPALDVVAELLYIVNLKNAYWRLTSGPEAEVAAWQVYWTSGRQGRASWPRVVAKLKAMGYGGPICLTAEYSDEQAVDRLIAEDLAFAQALLAAAEPARP